ncbi:hypothetical protein GA0061078_0096 [Bifidobacterium bohemicum]|uniref:Uncharacterized protein n=1 Tax=Bifidobacterium bohemicum DSM 22767 TaxID=1437606 RepID=A0A086ZFK4_9BIFI|nr:hypothetical protein BBOH_1667 [Bifidobacterium bohemicum DSM 22767]SCC20128.1 hypothetical protein GA0061078_0096 [Bifidobacterium bohemicum]
MSLRNKPDTSADHITDPSDALRILQSQRKRTALNNNLNSYGNYALWGIAWLIAYCSMALGTTEVHNGDTSTKAWRTMFSQLCWLQHPYFQLQPT